MTVGPRLVLLIGLVAGLLAGGLPAAHAYQRPGRTIVASVAHDGAWSGHWSSVSAISADGGAVAFSSSASNLVPDDTNGVGDIFVRDLIAGTTERVSVASDGTEANSFSPGPGVSGSYLPSISADGRYVSFSSAASNLVPDDTNEALDVFVHDRETGQTERVSLASDGIRANERSYTSAISADGRFVAFESLASNLVEGDTNNTWDVFVHDRQTGQTERVSVDPDGSEFPRIAWAPAISAGGRHVAFASLDDNPLAGQSVGPFQVETESVWRTYVHDRQTGQTEIVAQSWGTRPAISADGRFVAFESPDATIVPEDTNGYTDVFVHDRVTGRTERVSVASDGTEPDAIATSPALSADGRYVAFTSSATNLVPGITTTRQRVYLHDRATRTTELASLTPGGAPSNTGNSQLASLSADASRVAFHSFANDLVPENTNSLPDVYVRERGRAVDVVGLRAQTGDEGLEVSGEAVFGNRVVAYNEAFRTGPLAGSGLELAAASISYRAENPQGSDLLVRWELSRLPAGLPGVVYAMKFQLGGVTGPRYEVRAARGWLSGAEPHVPYFGLFACNGTCEEVATLSGAFGATGEEILASVPLDLLAAEPGTHVGFGRAVTAAGTPQQPGPDIDSMPLSTGDLPVRTVTMAVSPPGAAAEEVAYELPAKLDDGGFSVLVPADRLPDGPVQVWAEACEDTECSAATILHGQQE